MKHQEKHNQGFWRIALLAVLLGGGGGAQALVLLPDAADAATLQCLHKESALQVADEQLLEQPGGPTFLRVRLMFTQADQAPAVEILASTITIDVREQVLRHVATYRLPCLGVRAVSATQEFHFNAARKPDIKPLRLLADNPVACVVIPPRGPDTSALRQSGVIAKVFIAGTFDGDALTGPKVKQIYSDGPASLTASVGRFLAEYRMPCRKVGDRALNFRHHFTFAVDATQAEFALKRMPLMQFLGAVRDIKVKRAYFDFNGMGCPFQVQWMSLQPIQSNEALALVDWKNPNRAEFLAWLAELELALGPQQVKQLLGETLLIDVPCGKLQLNGEVLASSSPP